jgi:hypothetical protein
MTPDALRAHTRAGAKADARKLVETALSDERRRIADRRKGDRRATDRAPVFVIPPLDCEEGGMYEDLVAHARGYWHMPDDPELGVRHADFEDGRPPEGWEPAYECGYCGNYMDTNETRLHEGCARAARAHARLDRNYAEYVASQEGQMDRRVRR